MEHSELAPSVRLEGRLSPNPEGSRKGSGSAATKDKSMLTSAKRLASYLTGAATRELRSLLLDREARIGELEVEIKQVAEGARATVGQRESRIRELEIEIGKVAEEARTNSKAVGQRESRIRELEIEVRQLAEEVRTNSSTVGQRESRIRELESEIGLAAEHVPTVTATAIEREGRIRELEIEVERMAKEARTNSSAVFERDRRINELENEIRRVVDEVRSIITHRESRVLELERELQAQNTFVAPWDAAASPEERALIAWKAAAGWCTEEKARWLATLVTERRATSALEVGVFGGKSFLPMAAAMTCWGGIAYGVEPWSSEISIAEPTNIKNDLWWTSVDMRAVKSNFYIAVARLGLASQVRMLESPSDQARHVFAEKRFDLIHIDGSHAPGQALRDVRQWSPLLSPGGVLVLDDITWPSLADARAFAEKHFKLLDVREEAAAYVQRPDLPSSA